MDEDSTTTSIRTIFGNLPNLCRFCFYHMLDSAPSFNVFISKIGPHTILEIVKNYFAVVERTTIEQYLNGKTWTTNHLEVKSFQLNTEERDLCCICVDCLQVIIESTWFANHLRSHNLKPLVLSTLSTMLSNCTLVATQGEIIPKEILMPSSNYEHLWRKTNDLSNACIFCFEHNSTPLLDIFLSKIMGSTIIDIIKTCSTTYKEEEIYEIVHLAKSIKKTITVVDFVWHYEDGKVTPRKVCLNCLIPLVQLKALIERIRKTNEAIPFVGLKNKLDGSIEINIPYSNWQDILSDCTFMTCDTEIVPNSKIYELLKATKGARNDQLVEHSSEVLVNIVEISKPLESTPLPPMNTLPPMKKETQSIYCKYCSTYLDDCSSFEEHVLKCLKKDVIYGVEIHNSALCDNCLSVVFNKEEIMARLPTESFKNCSICTFSLYESRDAIDIGLSFTNFLAKYFK